MENLLNLTLARCVSAIRHTTPSVAISTVHVFMFREGVLVCYVTSIPVFYSTYSNSDSLIDFMNGIVFVDRQNIDIASISTIISVT